MTGPVAKGDATLVVSPAQRRAFGLLAAIAADLPIRWAALQSDVVFAENFVIVVEAHDVGNWGIKPKYRSYDGEESGGNIGFN
jgi:hypothetical protein